MIVKYLKSYDNSFKKIALSLINDLTKNNTYKQNQ